MRLDSRVLLLCSRQTRRYHTPLEPSKPRCFDMKLQASGFERSELAITVSFFALQGTLDALVTRFQTTKDLLIAAHPISFSRLSHYSSRRLKRSGRTRYRLLRKRACCGDLRLPKPVNHRAHDSEQSSVSRANVPGSSVGTAQDTIVLPSQTSACLSPAPHRRLKLPQTVQQAE